MPPKTKIGKNPRLLADKWFRLALRNFIRSYRALSPFGSKVVCYSLESATTSTVGCSFVARPRNAAHGAFCCAEGYFTQRAARALGCFSLGIEADVRRLTVAQNINTLERNELTGFMYAEVDMDSLSRLPKFDIVLFLSVLHHFMREHGSDYCREVLSIIRTKTNKVMIFDMGIESELLDWDKELPGIGEEPSAAIAELLRSAGFSQVDLIGHSSARKDRVARPMFRALP